MVNKKKLPLPSMWETEPVNCFFLKGAFMSTEDNLKAIPQCIQIIQWVFLKVNKKVEAEWECLFLFNFYFCRLVILCGFLFNYYNHLYEIAFGNKPTHNFFL